MQLLSRDKRDTGTASLYSMTYAIPPVPNLSRPVPVASQTVPPCPGGVPVLSRQESIVSICFKYKCPSVPLVPVQNRACACIEAICRSTFD